MGIEKKIKELFTGVEKYAQTEAMKISELKTELDISQYIGLIFERSLCRFQKDCIYDRSCNAMESVGGSRKISCR